MLFNAVDSGQVVGVYISSLRGAQSKWFGGGEGGSSVIESYFSSKSSHLHFVMHPNGEQQNV